jgi:hypothetical protein
MDNLISVATSDEITQWYQPDITHHTSIEVPRYETKAIKKRRAAKSTAS